MTTAAYLRVSTGQQSVDQQHDAIAAAGTQVRYYTQLIVAYPTSAPPLFSANAEGGPVSERYNGMPSYRWNGLTPHCY